MPSLRPEKREAREAALEAELADLVRLERHQHETLTRLTEDLYGTRRTIRRVERNLQRLLHGRP